MKTEIAQYADGTLIIKGHKVADLITKNWTVPDLIELLAGVPFSQQDNGRLINAMIVGFADHGLAAPSTMATRLAASCGSDLQKALIAALACMGNRHCPITAAYRFFQTAIPIALKGNLVHTPMPWPGFGHPIHGKDPRIDALFEVFEETVPRPQWKFYPGASAMQRRCKAPLNYAGAVAIVSLDIGLPAEFAQLAAMMGRLVGLTAHYREQNQSSRKLLIYDQDSGQFDE